MTDANRRAVRTASVIPLIVAVLVCPALSHAGDLRGWGVEHPLVEVPAGMTDARQIAAGKSCTLAVRADGVLFAWGTLYGNPIAIPGGLGSVKHVSVTRNHVATVRTDGSVVCWGDNTYGQCLVPSQLPTMKQVGAGWYFTAALGDDGALRVWTTIPNNYAIPSGNNFVKLAVAERGFLALRSDGTVAKWGGMVPPPPTNLTEVVDLACTDDFGVAVHEDGSITQWASSGVFLQPPPDEVKGLTRVTCATRDPDLNSVACAGVRADGSIVCWTSSGGWWTALNRPVGLAAEIALAPEHFCILRQDRSVECLALNPVPRVPVTTPPKGLQLDFAQVAAGKDHSVAVLRDGSIVEWGNLNFGQGPSSPEPPRGPGAAVLIDTFFNWRTLATREDGSLFAFHSASNAWCEAVNADESAVDVVQIDCKAFHALALLADGTVKAWGTPGSYYAAAQVPAGLTDVRQVAASMPSSLALRADGSLVWWGSTYENTQFIPSDLGSVSSIGAGLIHFIAVRSDGTVRCWGSNAGGQCNVPAGLTNVVAVSGGAFHSVALRANGTVMAWGYSPDGETNVPADLRHVRSVHAGYTHSLAIVDDSCVGDLDRDGAVMGADLGVLLTQWGQVGAPRGDINADGVVDSIDLGFLIGQWGPCPE